MLSYKNRNLNNNLYKIGCKIVGVDVPHGYDARIETLPYIKHKPMPVFIPDIMKVYQRTERRYKWQRRWFWIKQWLFWIFMFVFVGMVIVGTMYLMGNWN